STVLLVNDGILPLDPGVASVAVIGPDAAVANIMGGGSAQLNPHSRTAPLDVLRARLGDRLVFDPGDSVDTAADVAGKADIVVVIVGSDGKWESEGHDRTTMHLPGAQ